MAGAGWQNGRIVDLRVEGQGWANPGSSTSITPRNECRKKPGGAAKAFRSRYQDV
jgi:hypothetical protein